MILFPTQDQQEWEWEQPWRQKLAASLDWYFRPLVDIKGCWYLLTIKHQHFSALQRISV